jgi:GT2 family glycosyltransferase
MAKQQPTDYVICGNNDILFTDNWHERMVYHLDNTPNVGMVGPMSNAPGITAKPYQEIKQVYPEFALTDNQKYLNHVANHIYENRGDNDLITDTPAGVNGFFLMAKLRTWWSYPFDKLNCFKPRNDRNSKGRRNPTPLMTLNEDELQRRWRNHGTISGVVRSSFIFHYRAVTRGEKYKRGQWYRKQGD